MILNVLKLDTLFTKFLVFQIREWGMNTENYTTFIRRCSYLPFRFQVYLLLNCNVFYCILHQVLETSCSCVLLLFIICFCSLLFIFFNDMFSILGNPQTTSIMIASLYIWIWTCDLPNVKQKCCLLDHIGLLPFFSLNTMHQPIVHKWWTLCWMQLWHYFCQNRNWNNFFL